MIHASNLNQLVILILYYDTHIFPGRLTVFIFNLSVITPQSLLTRLTSKSLNRLSNSNYTYAVNIYAIVRN